MNPFVIGFLVFIFGANTYLFTRFTTVFVDKLFVPNYVIGLVWFVLTILSIVFRNDSDVISNEITDVLYLIGSYWIVIVYYGLLLTLTCDMIGFLQNQFGFTIFRQSSLVTGLGIIFIIMALVIYGSFNADRLVVVRYDVKINKPATDKSMRIVMLSDTHFGKIWGREKAGQIVDEINKLDADIVVLAGDTIDGDLAPVVRKNPVELFKGIKTKYGVFAVMGNHEYIEGGISEKAAYLQSNDINVLIDEAYELPNNVVVFGRNDYMVTADSSDFLEKAALYSDKPLIVADHQPRRIKEAQQVNADLLLSGHTHKGQFVPNNFVVEAIYELAYGYKLFDKLHMIVSCGVGTWGPPVRIGNQPEIVVVDIEFE